MLRVLRQHFGIGIVSLFLLVFLWPEITHATNAPMLTSPPNNSQTSKSPKLTWEYTGDCIESGSCFRIEIDNNENFSSPEKETYTNSQSYSPRDLTEGTWHWRVKAKDKADKWSEWSQIFKFIVGGAFSSPPLATISPTSTPSPSNQPESKKSSNQFEIKDIPQEVNSNQEFEVTVVLKTDKPNSKFFIKGALRKGDSLNYFGETYSGAQWSKNGSSYSGQFKIETDSDGKWEGKVKVKPDAQDSGFDGSGDYNFKVGRYTDSGNGPVWSNQLSLKINYVDIPEPSPIEELEEAEEELEEVDLSASIIKAAPSRAYEIKIASVAGEATKSDNITLEEQTRVLEEKKVNWLLIILGIGILIFGIGFVGLKIQRGRINANNKN